MDDWHRRDLPLLTLVAEAERGDARALDSGVVAKQLGLEKQDVWRGFNALREAGYVNWTTQARYPWDRYVVVAPRLAERGRREILLWPPDGLEALIAVLEQRIEDESEPDQRSKLERLLGAIRGLPREVGVELIAELIAGLGRR